MKMFLKVRSFSYTKDFVTRYKTKGKQGKKKALRKNLKQSSEALTVLRSCQASVNNYLEHGKCVCCLGKYMLQQTEIFSLSIS